MNPPAPASPSCRYNAAPRRMHEQAETEHRDVARRVRGRTGGRRGEPDRDWRRSTARVARAASRLPADARRRGRGGERQQRRCRGGVRQRRGDRHGPQHVRRRARRLG
jgi:hypothetical protein